MSINAKADTKTVKQLFSGKVFVVPDYQRMYSWEMKNWEDFWNDIIEGLRTKTEHYWGTITLRPVNKKIPCRDEYLEVYEIIDGQQRLTTLYLFIYALSCKGFKGLYDNYIKCGDVYRLELNSLNNSFLKDLIDRKVSANDPRLEIKSNRLLKEALEFFETRIKKYKEKRGDLAELARYVQSLTFSLEFDVLDRTLAIKSFESLNDRGKPLTLLDKVKSFLMFYSFRYLGGKLDNLIQNSFGKVFTDFDLIKNIGDKEDIDYVKKQLTEDDLLRIFYHYFADFAIRKYNLSEIAYSYDISAENVYEEFIKKACNILKHNPKKLEDFISEFLNDFTAFTEAFKRIIEKVKDNCFYRKLFVFLGINPLVYPLIIGLEARGMLNDELLRLIETLDLRVYKIRGTRPRADLYREIIAKIRYPQTSIRDIINSIRSFIKYFMKDSLLDHKLSESIYPNPVIKYILWEYEKSINSDFDDCDGKLFRELTVEHVFPETPTFSFPAYNFDSESEYLKIIDTLGNLTLLEESINKAIKNRTPNAKADFYQKSKIKSTREIGHAVKLETFKKNNILERTHKIIEFCKKRWHI